MERDTEAPTLVLVGGGHSHLAVLQNWARRPMRTANRILISPERRISYSGMIPGWMAGCYPEPDITLDLGSLAAKGATHLIRDQVKLLDADKRILTLDSGQTLGFDFLSLAPGGEIGTSDFCLLGDRLIPARPTSGLIDGWKRVLRAARSAPIQLAIVGGGAAGVELALGAWAGLRSVSLHSRVCIVTPLDGFLDGFPGKVRHRISDALSDRGITIHFAQAAASEDGLYLSNETALAADFVIAAIGSVTPAWIRKSGLQCTRAGFVEVGANLQSISHSGIFAAGDIVERIDRPVARSGIHAVKAGPILAENLRRAVGGKPLARYSPRRNSLYIIALGDRRAVASWGPIAWSGHMAWRLKKWIDRRFVRRQREGYANAMTLPIKTASKAEPRVPHQVGAEAGRDQPKLLAALIERTVVANGVQVSLFVGTCLNLINQGPIIWSGGQPDWLKVALNYAVPYGVSTYSSAKANRLARQQHGA